MIIDWLLNTFDHLSVRELPVDYRMDKKSSNVLIVLLQSCTALNSFQ